MAFNKFIGIFCIVIIFFVFGCNDQSDSNKISGAYEAMQLFSQSRAYPNKDIPNDAYTKAYEYVQGKFELTKGLDEDTEPWEAKGPWNTAGRCLALAVNPQADSTIYFGSASGGLWRSRKLGLGVSWERINTGFPVLGVSSIAFAPGDSMNLYIATGEMYNYSGVGTDGAYRSTRGSYGIGILKSEDGGYTWKKSLDWSYQQQRGVNMVKVDPNNSDFVFAATSEGIYKSSDAGESWTQVLDVIMGMDVVINPNNSDNIVAGFGNFGTVGRGIYFSNDGGENWSKSTTGVPSSFQGKIQLAFDPLSTNTFYASIGNGFSSADGASWLLRSNNGGATWSTRSRVDYSKWQGWFSHDVAADPFNPDHLMVIGIDVFASTNGGLTLNQKSSGGVTLGRPPIDGPDGNSNYSHSDHHTVVYHPRIEDLVLIGNDGGFFFSADGGNTFRSANGGLQTTQFYNGFSVSQQNDDFAMGGLQDNSTSIFRGDEAFERSIGGDGSWTGINFFDDRTAYGSYQNLNIFRSRNRGANFSSYLSFKRNNDVPLFIAPYVLSQSDPDRMYTGGTYVYRSDDQGTSWYTSTSFRTMAGGDPIFAMGVAPSDDDILYVGTAPFSTKSGVYVTRNAGISWEDITGDLPDRFPNDIVVDPIDPDIAYVCFSGFGSGHVFRTSDGGDTWEDISGTLPDVPTSAVEIDPLNPNFIYCGTDEGVYFSGDSGQTWERFHEGLPNAVIVMDLKVSPSNRKIWVATHGNGTYLRDLVEELPSNTENIEEEIIDFKIFPNPSIDKVIVNFDLERISNYSLSLFDFRGQLIKEIAKAQRGIGEQSVVMYRDGLLNGKYLLVIETQGGRFTKQIQFVD